MNTTQLIKLLKRMEHGGATGRPRAISFKVDGKFIPEPLIEIDSAGDGLFTELTLRIESPEEYCTWQVDDERGLAKCGCDGRILTLASMAYADYCPSCKKPIANVTESTPIQAFNKEAINGKN